MVIHPRRQQIILSVVIIPDKIQFRHGTSSQPINKQAMMFLITNIRRSAPDRHLLAGLASAQEMASANGFFQAVNNHYHSDLLHALRQPDMRSWAQSIGLIDANYVLPTSLSKSRKAEISNTVKNNALDSRTKLESLRLYLR